MLYKLDFRLIDYLNLFNFPANVKNLCICEKLVILPLLKGVIKADQLW